MNGTLLTVCSAAAMVLLASSLPAKTGRDSAPERALSVRVYDQAGVPTPVLNAAMEETGRLFRRAGIRITWQQPATEALEDMGTDMTAAAVRQSNDRSYLVIRFMRQAPARILPGALAYSLPFAHRGAHLVIFFDRIKSVTRSWNVPPSVVLGDTMAHELGHVLLRSSEHTSGGLMQACWTEATWGLAAAGLVVFDRAEMKRMRATLPEVQAVEPVPPSKHLVTSLASVPRFKAGSPSQAVHERVQVSRRTTAGAEDIDR